MVVITLDTTRADHLSCYGYDKIKTPRIDAVAQEGVLFEEAFSSQPVTLPSHCSIFTGKRPFHHGVRDNNIYKLSPENLTLAEIGRVLTVTESRVCQIHTKAVMSLRNRLMEPPSRT